LESGQRAQFSTQTHQLAEQYHMGSPIGLYNMQPRWIRIYQMLQRVLLGVVICTALFLLTIAIFFFYQYLLAFANQIPDISEKLMLSLPGIVTGLIGCIGCIIMRNIIAQRVPASFLVCTEGLLEMYPGQIVVTRWAEVEELLQGFRSKKKVYQLIRKNRKPLFFTEVFENLEDLADLVNQHIKRG